METNQSCFATENDKLLLTSSEVELMETRSIPAMQNTLDILTSSEVELMETLRGYQEQDSHSSDFLGS